MYVRMFILVHIQFNYIIQLLSFIEKYKTDVNYFTVVISFKFDQIILSLNLFLRQMQKLYTRINIRLIIGHMYNIYPSKY